MRTQATRTTRAAASPPSTPSTPSTPNNAETNAAPEFTCPFSLCTKKFKRMHALRTHLSPKCLASDEHHPKDNALWEEIQKSKIFAYLSRGGDLTEEEKKARESKASARSYRKHQSERTARSKRNREELREISDVAAHLGDAVDPLLAAAEHTSAALRDLQESLPPLETYIPLDDPPHIHTFRFVSFFLP